jgi:hypothetical protein
MTHDTNIVFGSLTDHALKGASGLSLVLDEIDLHCLAAFFLSQVSDEVILRGSRGKISVDHLLVGAQPVLEQSITDESLANWLLIHLALRTMEWHRFPTQEQIRHLLLGLDDLVLHSDSQALEGLSQVGVITHVDLTDLARAFVVCDAHEPVVLDQLVSCAFIETLQLLPLLLEHLIE